jgi:hypothetical protein
VHQVVESATTYSLQLGAGTVSGTLHLAPDLNADTMIFLDQVTSVTSGQTVTTVTQASIARSQPTARSLISTLATRFLFRLKRWGVAHGRNVGRKNFAVVEQGVSERPNAERFVAFKHARIGGEWATDPSRCQDQFAAGLAISTCFKGVVAQIGSPTHLGHRHPSTQSPSLDVTAIRVEI